MWPPLDSSATAHACSCRDQNQIAFLSVFPKEKEFLYSPLTGLVLLDVHHVKGSELVTMNTVRSFQRPINSVLNKEVSTSICTRARTVWEIRRNLKWTAPSSVICLQIVCIQLICLLFCFCFNTRSIFKLCVSPDPRAPLALKSNDFLCPHLLTLHLPIQLPYQRFLQNERNFLQEELSRVEVELAQLTNADTGNTSR